MNDSIQNKNYAFQSNQHIFFTSDMHFGHENIIRFCSRPYKDAAEMNEDIIKRWNDRVRPDDIVFILGDILFGGSEVFYNTIPRLNGKKYLIYGNHDYKNFRPSYKEYFVKVLPKMFISIDGQKIILNHEPLLCYGGQANNKTWHLFGHVHTSHNKKQGSDFERMKLMSTPTMYDVGVDFNDYAPISFEEVKEKIEKQIRENKNYIALYK